MQRSISALAEFAVRGRTHIHRNGRSKEIDYVPEPEAATRLAQQLAQLAKGSALVMERATVEDEDYQLVTRVAFDCTPAPRRRVLDALMRSGEGEKSTGAASTLHYAREELAALGLLTTEGALSELSRDLLRQADVM